MPPILSLKLGVKIPPGYHYVTEGYTLNAYENPGIKMLVKGLKVFFKEVRILASRAPATRIVRVL
jgi:hypothetical protein